MRRVVIVASAALLLVPLVLKSRMSQEIPVHAAFYALSSGRVSVKACGDLMHSGIYEVPANTLATSVINMAVPIRPLTQYVIAPSAARPLLNGSTVNLTVQPDGTQLITAARMTVPERLVLKIPLDIDTMSEADFDRLPGIGPSLARRISEYRQNHGGLLRVSDLAEIEGIGEKRGKSLRAYFQQSENTK